MQWTDITAPPARKTLRQFAALWLLVFGGWAAWRGWHGDAGAATRALAIAAVAVGVAGLVRPALVRWVYTGWMAAVFPIGWTVSRVMIGALFYLVFTPVAFAFRLMGRDALGLRRGAGPTAWTPKSQPADVHEYFRQS